LSKRAKPRLTHLGDNAQMLSGIKDTTDLGFSL
jgi:hypothetical protein